MNMTTNASIPQTTFDDIRQVDTQGNEFWYARALSKLLDSADYRNFLTVIKKVKIALETSEYKAEDHLGKVTEMIDLGKGGQRKMPSFSLSRHACYLVVQNADSSKPVIAHGQPAVGWAKGFYFAHHGFNTTVVGKKSLCPPYENETLPHLTAM